jgi:hypothetical protein
MKKKIVFFFKKNFQVFWAPDAQKLGTGDLGTGPPATQKDSERKEKKLSFYCQSPVITFLINKNLEASMHLFICF